MGDEYDRQTNSKSKAASVSPPRRIFKSDVGGVPQMKTIASEMFMNSAKSRASPARSNESAGGPNGDISATLRQKSFMKKNSTSDLNESDTNSVKRHGKQ